MRRNLKTYEVKYHTIDENNKEIKKFSKIFCYKTKTEIKDLAKHSNWNIDEIKELVEFKGISSKLKTILKKLEFNTLPDKWGFFEEKNYGFALKPISGNNYSLRNNTDYRGMNLPGAATKITEINVIKALNEYWDLRYGKRIIKEGKRR